MNKTIRALAASLLIGGASFAATALMDTPVLAATIKTPAVAKLMKDAQAAARSGNWREALAKAQQADGIAHGAEAAVVTQFIAYAATNAGAYGIALNAYDKMIQSGTVNRTEGLKTALRLAIRANQPQRAMQYANQLGGADPLLVAQLQYQSGNYREVIRLLSGQINGGNRDSLVLLQNSYYKIGDTAGTQRVLEALALHYPSPETWHDAIRIFSHGKGLSDRGLLELSRMRLLVGDLKDHTDFFEAAELAMAQNLPAEAKAVLDKGVAAHVFSGDRDQRLINLANTKLAQDPAVLGQLRAQADANPGDGNADVKFAEALWTYGKYPDAERYVRRGIKEGHLLDPDYAKIVLGHVLLSQGRRQEAANTFASVAKDGKMAPVGRLWSLMARAGVGG